MLANVAETINNDQFTLYMNVAWRPLSLYELHCHLGHIHYGAIKDAIQNGLVKGLEINPNNSDEEFCKAWAAGKPTTQLFPKESLTHATDFGERVHWDLWGPASVKSLGRKLLQFTQASHGLFSFSSHTCDSSFPHLLHPDSYLSHL